MIKGTRNKKTGIWEVPLGTQQSEKVGNKILGKTSKQELAHYLHASILSPTAASLLKATKQGFLKTWLGLTEKLINKYFEKPSNTTMGHLNMIRKRLQSTRETPSYTDLEDKIKNVVFCTTVDPSTTKKGNIYSDLYGRCLTTPSRERK